MNVGVVLPAFNEEGNLTPLIAKLDAALTTLAASHALIVVNDGSRDGTAAELEKLRGSYPALDVVTHPVNRGFAGALKTGIGRAIERDCDVAVFLDSDLSHRVEDLPGMLDAINNGADVVIGSRFVPGGGMQGVPLWRVLISRAGNIFGRAILRMPVTDLTSGYRVVRREVLKRINLGEDGFTIQLESVVKAYAAGFKVVEAPIVLGTRLHGESHMAYNPALFRAYWRLLLACRRWLRQS